MLWTFLLTWYFFRTTSECTQTVIRRLTATVTASITRTVATATSSSDRVNSAKRDSVHRHIHPQKTNFVNLFWRKSSSPTQFATHWVKLKVSWRQLEFFICFWVVDSSLLSSRFDILHYDCRSILIATLCYNLRKCTCAVWHFSVLNFLCLRQDFKSHV